MLETCRGAACAALPGGRTFALPPATRSVSLRVSCAPAPARRCARTGTPVAAGVTVTSADVTLEDSAAPGPPAQLTGRVFEQGASGRSSVELQALDEGSGVASLEVRVDGQTTATYPVTSCARFAASRYLTPHPCPNMRRFELPLPTGGLSNGVHTVQVRVHDAVGNVGVSLPRLASVFNPGQPGAFARVRGVLVSGPQQGERLTVRYASPLTITGQLQDAQGRPLPALTVEAGSTGDSRRVRATSDAQGRFSLPFPAARSGVVSLVAMSGTRAIGVQELALHVRPSIILHAVAARARNGQSIAFEGLVLPAPAQPLVATLQALDGKRWTNVGATITILATGRFATRFEFRHTSRRTRFAFRVHLPQQGAYPFEADSSRVVRVLVRP